MDPIALNAYRAFKNVTEPPSVDAPETGEASFGEMLNGAVRQLERLQGNADAAMLKMATGQPVELHEAMLAVEQANLGFQVALQVRSKIIEAYQEVMRTQV